MSGSHNIILPDHDNAACSAIRKMIDPCAVPKVGGWEGSYYCPCWLGGEENVGCSVWRMMWVEVSPPPRCGQSRCREVYKSVKYNYRIRTFLGKGRILRRNPGKNLKSFPPSYSQSPLQHCRDFSHATSFVFRSVTVHFKEERRKT